MTEYPRMDETGHNPDVLVSALVHNRAKDKFLVAKRIGTLGKGASPKAVKSPTPSLSSPHLLYPPAPHSQPHRSTPTHTTQAASKPPAAP